MTSPQAARAVNALIDEAWDAHRDGRYVQASAAGERAVRAATGLNDPALLVRALAAEAAPLMMLGDDAALVRYTRVLAIAEDPNNAERLANEDAAWAVGFAFVQWADCARFTTSVSWPELFGVLDAAERWLIATGHRHWRAGVLLERALLHQRLGNVDAAVDAAQEALEAYQPGAPGFSLSGHRFQLGDILRDAARYDEARLQYQAILDDPKANPYNQQMAHRGLARCAQNDGDLDAARRHAIAAVRLAEPLGDECFCPAQETLVVVLRAAGDLDSAWREVTRYIEAADRIGGHYRPYFAVRDAADIALDRGDLESARGLIDALEAHASAMDTAHGSIYYAGAVTRRRARLAELESAEQPGAADNRAIDSVRRVDP